MLNTIYIVLKAQIDNRNLLKTIPYTWRSKKHKENRKLRLFSFCWQLACGVRLLSCFARICIYTFRIAYAFIQWLTTSDSSQRGNKHKKYKFQKSFRGFYRERLRNRESIGAFLFLSAKCSADGTDEFSAVSWILSGVRRTDIWVGKIIPLARNRERKPSTVESEIQQKQCSLIK